MPGSTWVKKTMGGREGVKRKKNVLSNKKRNQSRMYVLDVLILKGKRKVEKWEDK